MSESPTSVRSRVLLLFGLIAGITYLDRSCISAAAPRMMADLKLSTLEMGYVFSVFALAYGLAEIPAGWMGDHLGQRKMLSRIVVCWSVFTALTGAVRNFVSLIAVRFIFGAAEAGAFPTMARGLARWFPLSDRGRVIGLMWLGARIGGSLGPLLAALLTGWLGWRASFLVFGIPGVAVGAICWLWYRDRPSEHRSVNAVEAAYIGKGAEASQRSSAPWRRIFLSANLWALFWMYFVTSYGFWFFLTWMPTYLMREQGLGARKAGFYSALPLLFGAITCLSGGALSDWLVARTGSLRWGRSLVGLGGFLLSAAGFYAAAFVHGPGAAVACLTFAEGMMDLAVPVAWAACLEVGGSSGGTATAFMNTASSISAAISPVAAAWLFNTFGSFSAMFQSAACAYFLAGLLWLRIDSARPIPD